MQHVIPANVTSSLRANVTPELADWKYLSFQIHAMVPGQYYRGESLGCEVALVFLSGDAEVKVNGQRWSFMGRRDVFAGLPYAAYVPPDHAYEVVARSGLELAVGMAPAKDGLAPRLITPDEVKVEIRGGHNVTRQISHILDPGDAEKLLCVEVYTPSGNWSSYPPHKHDVHAPPAEVKLEEVYHYRFQPQDGWAMQRLYSDDRSLNEVVLAKHGDTVLIRRGYHPVVTAPGYDCYYLNFLAGDTPAWEAKDDPQLAWVRGNWEGQEDRLRLPLKGKR